MPPKSQKAKKTAIPISKAGAKSVDPLAAAKKAIEAKLNCAEKDATIKTEVDQFVPVREKYQVIKSDSSRVMSVYLMWSDLKNNHNKFYILQALENKTTQQAFLWVRYGRVGVTGVTSQSQMSKELVIKSFLQTERKKKSKGYTEIQMSLGSSAKPVEPILTTIAKKEYMPSKLDPNVQDFVKLIFNTSLMEQSVVNIGYDAKKMPLGELSKETVLRGYKILNEIEAVLEKKSTASLADLSSQFYTNIPHNFGMRKMSLFIIDSSEKVKEKLDLIQNLIDIQVAHDLIKDKPSAQKTKAVEENKVVLSPSPIDQNFLTLKIKMDNLKPTSSEYQMIDKYIQTGKSSYTNLTLVDCFKIVREGEEKVFNPDKLGNKKLLWHGSRFSNFVGILSQGLRIAPPEAPSTGYLFGKGVYFADIIGKSFSYACPHLSHGVGVYILAEVALGNTRELPRPDHGAANLPKGKNSTHGLGRQRPDPSGDIKVLGDVTVPLGKIQNHDGNFMGANEHIVYNTNQVRMHYIVRIKQGN